MLRLVRRVYEMIPKRIDPRARRYFRLAIYYYLKKKTACDYIVSEDLHMRNVIEKSVL